MSSKVRPPGLYEFLQEAELQHYYNSLKNILQIQNVPQLKYVMEDDLRNIGMSKPECRRLKTFYNKYCPGNYASKIKKFLGRKDEGREEFLLGKDTLGSRGQIKVPSQHVIQADSISVYKELGQGEFGVVQQGVWTDEEGMRHQVAVKCLSKERMQNNTIEFMKEYDIMQAIDHTHIVRLYGVILDAAQIMLITELAPLRSLLECLREPSLRSTFTVPCLANFAHQICQGMAYLESRRLIHRDLAARNILVFSKDTVKISDFGLSRALGVGKDYYQTNFNVNLKLPIAWCAPECINFLKFTTSSDVWAFAVTVWEMFSYGFQPWAALTGQQILEAIDEPGGQRLERPVHCPQDYYSVMEACWRHDPAARPTFASLVTMLEEAKPEQVQVVTAGPGGGGTLQYAAGEVLTVLDREATSGHATFWTGVSAQGKVGWFLPSHTVTYLGDLPSLGAGAGLSRETRKGSNRKISRDMISAPSGNMQHTGHVGADGCFFGDVAFISGTNGRLTVSSAAGPDPAAAMSMSLVGRLPSDPSFPVGGAGGRLPSSGSENGFSSLSRADSDVSDSAPLLASSAGSGSGAAEKLQPRMGHAIGYLRRPDKDPGLPLPPLADPRTHQYQSISDDENEFGSPLDLGPSLLDEVFSELGNYDTLKLNKEDKKDEGEDHHGIGHNIVDIGNKIADKVSTLTLSRKHKGKKAAFVKPIKASDEKTLEKAIKMANQLASKSMQDLDKRGRGGDDMFSASPEVSPITPNSPTKKFSFKFPSSSTGGRNRSASPKANRLVAGREEGGGAESLLTPGARDAYKALIEGGQGEELDTAEQQPGPGLGSKCPSVSSVASAAASHRLSLPPTSSVFSYSRPPAPGLAADREATPDPGNPIPLPPREGKSHVTAGKRHVRKNPLILTSGVASAARRFESDEPAPAPGSQAAPVTGSGRTKNTHDFSPSNDAFEEEIAYSIDALDELPEAKYPSPKSSLCDPAAGAEARLASDEVRIMSKVLGGVTADTAGCVQALDLTDWNVHRAIKLVKLKAMIRKPGVKDNDMKVE